MNITTFATLIKKNYFLIIILLLIFSFNNFFYNIYALYIRDYDERMLRSYNYCGGVSYGYIKKISEKFLKGEKKTYIINFELNPPSYGLFYNLKMDKRKNSLILLNYDEKNENILKNEKINFKEYQLIDRDGSCFYYEKK